MKDGAVETYTWTLGHDPTMGWLLVTICVVLFALGWKQRMFTGPIIGIVLAVVYLVARLDMKIGGLVMVAYFIGVMFDSVRSVKWKEKSRRYKFGTAALVTLALAMYLWLGFGDTGEQIILSDSSLTQHPGRDIFLRKYPDTVVPRRSMTATLVHAKNGPSDQWRFRAIEDPETMVTIDTDSFYRTEETTVSGEQLARHILTWAGVTHDEKTVDSLVPELEPYGAR